MQIQVKKLDPRAKLPSYGHPGDAGLDFYALEDALISAGQRAQVRTGIALVVPSGYTGLVWDRSSLSHLHGLHSIGGVFDAGFTGEYIFCFFNTSQVDYKFKAGDKVAQLLIQPVAQVEVVEVSELPQSERGAGSFGSTGK